MSSSITPYGQPGMGLISGAMNRHDSKTPRVGSRRVIDTRTFIVPAGDRVSFELDTGSWAFPVELVFQPNAHAHAIVVESMGGLLSNGARINFSKWVSQLGTATKEPAQLASLADGQKVSFMVAHYVIGPDALQGTVKIDIQFYIED